MVAHGQVHIECQQFSAVGRSKTAKGTAPLGGQCALPPLKKQFLVHVYGFLVVRAEVVHGCQAELVLNHILQVLVVGHHQLLITKLYIDRQTDRHTYTTPTQCTAVRIDMECLPCVLSETQVCSAVSLWELQGRQPSLTTQHMYPTVTCSPPSHVPHRHMYPTVTCSPPSHVPHRHMFPTVTCTPPSHVPHRHMYPTVTCTPPSHVPHRHMYPTVTCTPPSHVPLRHMYPTVTCTPPSHVPHCHMYPTVTCTLLSHVPHCHMYPTVTCTPPSHVPHCHMYPTITCTPPSHVPLCHMYPSVTCTPLSHVPLCHTHTFSSCVTGLLVHAQVHIAHC